MLKYLKYSFLTLIFLSISKIIKDSISAKSLKLNDNDDTFKYYNNYDFMLNYNIIQYSSYIMKHEENLKIQSIIHTNDKKLSNVFFCIIKSVKLNITIEVPSTSVISFAEPQSKQVTCDYKDAKNMSLNELLIAIVRKDDYGIKMTNNSWPKFMINFQKPKIVNVLKNKIHQVALCVQFVYKKTDSFTDWVKIQKDVGIAEIVLHDSTDERDLYKHIDFKFVDIRPYNVGFQDICRTDRLNFIHMRDMLAIFNQACLDFFNNEFKDKYELRGKHDHMSSNDCYLTMKEKYEFVAVYDLDETIFPRRISNETDDANSICDNSIGHCKYNSFGNNIYDYINELIDKNYYDHDKNKLRSIVFSNAFYLPTQDFEIEIMKKLKEIVDYKDQKFPVKLVFKNFPYFRVRKEDLEYVKVLISNFNSLKCLNTNDTKYISKDFNRFLFHVTDINDRWPKSIHYTNNVKSVFTHYSMDKFRFPKDNTEYFVNPNHGVLSHFRKSVSNLEVKRMKNLSIDLDYAKYLMNFACLMSL